MKPEPTPCVGPRPRHLEVAEELAELRRQALHVGRIVIVVLTGTLWSSCVTLIWTTAGSVCSTSALKSGSAAVGAPLTTVVAAAGFAAGTTRG